MLYERMEKEAADADEPETEARRKAMEEEEALLKVDALPLACSALLLHASHLSRHVDSCITFQGWDSSWS